MNRGLLQADRLADIGYSQLGILLGEALKYIQSPFDGAGVIGSFLCHDFLTGMIVQGQ